jgi:hypothetical protein
MNSGDAVLWVGGAFALGSLTAEFAAEPETFPVFRAWLAAKFPGEDCELLTIDKLREVTILMNDLMHQLPIPPG